MKIKIILCLALLSPGAFFGQNKFPETAQLKEDFLFFWQSINDDYAYFDKKQTDWGKVKENLYPKINTIQSRDAFVTLLENAFYEIYDHHAALNTNTKQSQRLVPSGTDLWAAFIDGKAIVTSVRKNFGSEKSGIAGGMEIVAVNSIPVNEAIAPFLPKSLKNPDVEARNFALRMLLAGNHSEYRKLTLRSNGKTKDYFPDQPVRLLENISYQSKTESKIIADIGYIKINDCLYNNGLIAEFDSIMQTMTATKALVLDLRETPSGGNTTVARAILGWFTDKDRFYQKHEAVAEEKSTAIKRSWMEIVSPRQGKYYSKPMVVLAGRWTGSVGEGIVIAFDGMERATTIGTPLAGLNGAIDTYELPNSKIRFSFPIEKLYHTNGLPRELYQTNIPTDFAKLPPTSGNDPELEKALALLRKKT